VAKDASYRQGGSPEEGESRNLWHYTAPRYWPAWLLIGWLKLVALLPLRWSIRLHRGIGWAMTRLAPGRRRKLARSLALCFPEYSPEECERLAQRNLENMAIFVAEIGAAWFGNLERLASYVTILGKEHLDAALDRGRGVILFSGHFTAHEIAVPRVKEHMPHFAFMYSRRGNPLVNEFQRRGRLRAAHESFPSDDARSMLRTLSRNGVVWYAPDQARAPGSETVQFFAAHFEMPTSTSRLARISEAAVLPISYYRKADDSGYVVRFDPPLADFPSDDLAYDAQRLTHVLEDLIMEAPEQYKWNRRKILPGDFADFRKPRRTPDEPPRLAMRQ